MNTNTKSQLKKSDHVVYKMLLENTGTHMLDSGGAGGRQWQRNQGKTLAQFRKEKAVTFEKDYGWTISLFHYLTRDLFLDPICEQFNKKFVPAKDWDCGELEEVYGVSKKGVEWLKEAGFAFKDTFNSYNGDSALSQVIQGTWLELNDEHYLILQIHGGCDVRGGYTDARLFYVPEYDNGVLSEDVYGFVKRKDGTEFNVDNRDSMVTLNIEDREKGWGGPVYEYQEGDQVELELFPF